jgi:hypothetical protein
VRQPLPWGEGWSLLPASMLRRLWVMGALVLWVGCGTPSTSDSGIDAETPDSGLNDGGPDLDAGSDAGKPPDGGNDGGANDGGANDGGANDGGANDGGANDGGKVDGGTTDGGQDAGLKDAGTDAGSQDAGAPGDASFPDGGVVMAIRFGASGGNDGIYTTAIANPDLRTVAGWFRLRINVPQTPRASNGTSQECIWSFEDNPPSTAYQLMVNTYQQNQWESHDRSQGGFLFAPVDLGWWFIAETNRAAVPATTLYWKKEGATTLNVTTGNKHPSFTFATRFLIGTDDATGQVEWFDGDIAGVKVWNAELTAAELAIEANHLNPVRMANLHAYYPFQSVATMFNDASGNGRNLSPIYSGGSWSLQTGPVVPY